MNPRLNQRVDSSSLSVTPTAELLKQAGIITNVGASGEYIDYLPLGTLLINGIKESFRRKSEEKGIAELVLSSVQPSSLIEKSGRMNQFEGDIHHLNGGKVLSPTHEEYVLELVKHQGLFSYKNYPINFFQLGNVFRNLGNKSHHGGLRTGEVSVYEGYSICLDKSQELNAWRLYDEMLCSIFTDFRIPIKRHKARQGFVEYLYPTSNGLEEVMCQENGEPLLDEPDVTKRRKMNAFDLAMIFTNDSGITEKSGFQIETPTGKISPILCSVGAGIFRTLFSLVESNRTPYGIDWPESIRPIQAAVMPLYPRDLESTRYAQELAADFSKNRNILLDDRSNISKRLGSLSLLGIPQVYVVYREEETKQVNISEGILGKTGYTFSKELNLNRDSDAKL